MVTRARLDRVADRLNIEQMVLMEIKQARRYPDLMSHALAVLEHPGAPAESLCGRIEAAVLSATKGKPERTRNEAVRSAQRRGLFLAYLANEANGRIAIDSRERELEGALLAALRALVASRPASIDGIQSLLDVAMTIGARARAQHQAVRLLEESYFGGYELLYPRSQAELHKCIGEADQVTAWARDLLEDGAEPPQQPPAEAASVRRSARIMAESMVAAAKVKVFYEFRQDSAARDLLRSEYAGQEAMPSEPE